MAEKIDPVALTSRFADALTYAAQVHAGQGRKGTSIPYIAHPLGVASIALEYGANEDETIAALLHDAIEDAPDPRAAKEEIRRRFGTAVAAIVEGCSDSETRPKPPWRERKERYLAHLPEASPSVRLVSASDKLHNTRAILRDHRELGEAVWTRFNAPKSETLWYYRALVTAFLAVGPRTLAEELDRVVTAIEQRATSR